MIVEIGTIKLNEKVMVSDPCYMIGTWCQGTVENVLPGTYHCFYVTEYESYGRVKNLIVVHEDHLSILESGYFFDEVIDETIGVDSGTCGIFDYEYYERYHMDSNDPEHEKWYRDKIDVQNGRTNFGITDEVGVWSESGYGDGCYPCYVHCDDNKKIVKFVIEFICDDEDDEDFDDYDEFDDED